MTAEELIHKAENVVEEKYTDAVWRGFIRSVLSEMASAAKMLTTKAGITVSLTSGNGEINVSTDADLANAVEILAVSFVPTGGRARPLRKLSAGDRVSAGWRRREGAIVLQDLPWDAGTADVDYYGNLTLTLSDGFHVMNLPEKYHDTVLKGVLAKAMQKEEELDRKQDFFAEYQLGKQEMLVERTHEMEPWNSQYVQGGRG